MNIFIEIGLSTEDRTQLGRLTNVGLTNRL